MIACHELAADVGTKAACNALDIARPTYYRRRVRDNKPKSARPSPPRTPALFARTSSPGTTASTDTAASAS